MPEEVDECVSSVLEDNPDYDESRAYAICNAQMKAVEAGADDPEAVGAVVGKVLTGEWPGRHEKEKTNEGRLELIDEYYSVAKSFISKDDAEEWLSKSDTSGLRKVEFDVVSDGPVGVLFKSDDDFVVWGPASVEIVDKENDRIKASALEKALPQLLKRSALSYEHSDQIVGDILERYSTDEPVEVTIQDETFERTDFPTDVLQLGDLPKALYVASNIYNDTKKSREVREKVNEGDLDSYSISGEAIVSEMAVKDGEVFNDILELDLSAITVCSEGMNQMAKFEPITKSIGPDDHSDSSEKAITQDEAQHVTKQRIQTMSDEDTETDEQEDPLTKSGMKDILDEALPDGEIATVEDVEKTVDEKVDETVSEKMGEYEEEIEDEVEEEVDDEVEDEVEDEMEDHEKSYTLDQLKSMLPDDQYKAIEPVLAEKEQAVIETDEEPDSGAEVVADEEFEDEEGDERMVERAAAKALDGLSDEEKEALIEKSDLDLAEGASPPSGDADGSAIDEGDRTLDEIAKSDEMTISASNWFDDEGKPKL